MKLIKSIAVAFSLYSAIPMPHFEWKEEDMRYSGCFFPLVGMVTGLLVWGIWCLQAAMDIPQLVTVLLMVATPLVITGGFHVDGYMDVCDAIKSYGDFEKRLAILKDPHIGAFSVICLVKLGLIYAAAIACIISKADAGVMAELGLSYIISRILSMITMKTFKLAKNDGMLSDEAKFANKRMLIAVCLELFVVGVFAIYIEAVAGLVLLVTAGLVTMYYRYFSYKNFGGITGDTAGYYVVVNECAMAVAMAVLVMVI